jgi:hypothetical protein
MSKKVLLFPFLHFMQHSIVFLPFFHISYIGIIIEDRRETATLQFKNIFRLK